MPPDRPAFEIGFVLAGAISAGCYSAGVMDFMIEARDDYYAERDKRSRSRSFTEPPERDRATA